MVDKFKPKVKLTETDGNVFAIIGACAKVLGKHDRATAEKFRSSALNAKSYDEVLQLAMEYCEVE